MMVVADTSPLNYLLLIGEIRILPVLFERVLIPPAVKDEMQHPGAPPVVSAWAWALPSWIEVVSPGNFPFSVEPKLDLGAGELEAIALAQIQNADFVALDDGAARQFARRQGLVLSGTLGILERAAQAGLLNLPLALEKLQNTSFYLSPALAEAILKRNA